MPTYDYECQACGHTYELFQSITAKPVKKCPECGKAKAKRLIGTGAGVIFKGSGFYQTDYRSEGYNKAAKADAEAAGGKSSDSKASDTKSEKSETKSSETSAPRTPKPKGKDKGGSSKD